MGFFLQKAPNESEFANDNIKETLCKNSKTYETYNNNVSFNIVKRKAIWR